MAANEESEEEQNLNAAEAALVAVIAMILLSGAASSVPVGYPGYSVATAIALSRIVRRGIAVKSGSREEINVNGPVRATLEPFVRRGVEIAESQSETGLSDAAKRAIVDDAINHALDTTRPHIVESTAKIDENRTNDITKPRQKADDAARIAARLISRDAVFTAQEESAKQLGLTKKKWITQLDDRVRTAHQHLHGQEISIGDRFVTSGGTLRWPGDQEAPTHLIANCRCALRFKK